MGGNQTPNNENCQLWVDKNNVNQGYWKCDTPGIKTGESCSSGWKQCTPSHKLNEKTGCQLWLDKNNVNQGYSHCDTQGVKTGEHCPSGWKQCSPKYPHPECKLWFKKNYSTGSIINQGYWKCRLANGNIDTTTTTGKHYPGCKWLKCTSNDLSPSQTTASLPSPSSPSSPSPSHTTASLPSPVAGPTSATSNTKVSSQGCPQSMSMDELNMFNENYSKELEKLYTDKMDMISQQFQVQQASNNQNLNRLKTRLENIDSLTSAMRGTDQHFVKSVQSVETGQKLNIKPVSIPTNPDTPASYVCFLNNKCLAYGGDGNYGLKECEMSNTDQHFFIQQVNNHVDYNNVIKTVNPNLKTPVGINESHNYPINLVSPVKNNGQCLTIDGDGVRILPCTQDNKQRFRPSDLSSNDSNCA